MNESPTEINEPLHSSPEKDELSRTASRKAKEWERARKETLRKRQQQLEALREELKRQDTLQQSAEEIVSVSKRGSNCLEATMSPAGDGNWTIAITLRMLPPISMSSTTSSTAPCCTAPARKCCPGRASPRSTPPTPSPNFESSSTP